ncbi:S1 RNA-binding domain-containing protein [Acetonema longum]|uniref:RNA binding S1 domain protein n=1 Tax=Acetonema longum DSM 6540 TaxID=1009370 RepID=F7NHS1_9FIRM|nr:S1-like domain-containing RNA-binding protein [Acetonema longum]EGO64446.1 RNA binding S1 domain protein [Acetonema longum DSM 6540]
MQQKATYAPGQVVTLKVARMNELGAFLDAGTGKTSDDILLHKAQQIREVTLDEPVEVYLYQDPKGRLAASMRLPQMKPGQVARVQVINTSRDGAFVDIGAERGVFMPYAGMRGLPRRGEKVWVKLYTDKSGRPAVTMEVDEELQKASRPAMVKVGDQVTGSVYNINEAGAFLFTAERNIALLHKDEMAERLKVGQEITARVTFVREDGRINVSLRPAKEKAMDQDGEKILALLAGRGKMPYSDESSPEVIKEKFQISKAAFKRALGKLMKAGLIEQQDGWTYLKKEEGENP